MERGHRTLEPTHVYRNHDYSPTGGKEGDTGSTTGGTLAADIAKHKELVDTEARKGKAGRKRRDVESDSDAVDLQVRNDERVAAEKGLERADKELKKARDALAERTAELKSAKQSLTVSNRARNEGDKEIHFLQKQLSQLKKQMELDKKQAVETVKAYNKVKETNRAKIADLEREIADQAPILEGLEERMDTLAEWSERDGCLRKEYLLLKADPPGEGDQAEKLRAAEAVLGILDRYLGKPQIGKPPSGSAGDQMGEEGGDQVEGEEAPGLEGDNPYPGGSALPGGEKRIKKRKDPVGETQPSRSSKKGGPGDSVTQMQPDKEAYGRLTQGLYPPVGKAKKLTKRQKLEAAKANDEDWYGITGPGPCTTADPFGDNNAGDTRIQAEADARARDLEVRNRLPDQEARPKTRSSTSSAIAASSAPPSPAISLVETPPDSPVEFATYADGRGPANIDYSSGEDSDRRERRLRRGDRKGDDEAEEEYEEAEEEENDEEDPPQRKEG